MKHAAILFAILFACGLAPAHAEDAEGCKDHPSFTRMPNHSLTSCEASQFDLRAFPVGKAKSADVEEHLDTVAVEGPTWTLYYGIDEGTSPASALQIMRNYQNAARAAGAEILGEYPGWCKAGYDTSAMPVGNGCANFSTTIKLMRGDTEIWAFVHPGDESYEIVVSERQAMRQEVSIQALTDQLARDGFVTLEVNFDTASTQLRADSAAALDAAAAALKASPDLRVEIGGHTDNVGDAAANRALSEGRAKAVQAALVERGIAASRLTAVGYGQDRPIADNRGEDGRAKNRRVELTRL